MDSAKVSALMVVPMMDFEYQLQTLAFPRWVYSGEAKKHEVYGRPAADTWVGWREPGDSLFCPCLTDSSRARVCTLVCIPRVCTHCVHPEPDHPLSCHRRFDFSPARARRICPSRAGLFTDLSMAGCLLPGLDRFTESPSPWSRGLTIVRRDVNGLGS